MNKQRMQPVPNLAALAVVALAASGCAVAAASTGLGVAYSKGNVETVVAATPEEVAAAAEATFDEMGIRLAVREQHEARTRVVGWTPEGKKVKVTAKPRGAESSKVAVRVGTFGNQVLRNQVYSGLVAGLCSGPEHEPAETSDE